MAATVEAAEASKASQAEAPAALEAVEASKSSQAEAPAAVEAAKGFPSDDRAASRLTLSDRAAACCFMRLAQVQADPVKDSALPCEISSPSGVPDGVGQVHSIELYLNNL